MLKFNLFLLLFVTMTFVVVSIHGSPIYDDFFKHLPKGTCTCTVDGKIIELDKNNLPVNEKYYSSDVECNCTDNANAV